MCMCIYVCIYTYMFVYIHMVPYPEYRWAPIPFVAQENTKWDSYLLTEKEARCAAAAATAKLVSGAPIPHSSL